MTDQQHGIDPALWRGLTQSRTSRRGFLRAAGVGAGALSLSSILAACGTAGVSTSSPAANGAGSAEWWSQQPDTTTLNYANWPYYIDTSHGKHPSVEEFQQQTGIQVTYTENINDNVPFFNKIRPDLQAGNYSGYDVIVLTNNDSPLSQMIQLGWALPLDQSRMTNFKKYASPLVSDPTWDPGNTYTMAWQSGYTCIGYNTKYIQEDITSIQSLFDSKYSGHIGMMGIAVELGAFGLLAIGVDPAASTPDDWAKAATKLEEQKPLVRAYYDQDYIKALKNEDIWISMVWSGDVFQAATYQGYDTLKTVIPSEGGMLWTDNQLIPVGAENPVSAMKFMDFVYDPQVQALIEDYNAYVCPVPAAKPIIANQLKDPTVADSPTVFPDAQMVSVSKPYYQFQNSQDLDQWNNTFVPIFQGGVAPPAERRHKRLGRTLSPYLLGGPALLWLVLFFVVPLITMVSLSIQTCDSFTLACKLTWHFGEYPKVINEFSAFFLRSFLYAGAATLATLVVSFPVAYWIAFRAKRKNFFLMMLLLPFFVSFVIRTTTWQFLLADQGFLLRTLRDLHLVPPSFHLLQTQWAVIAGIAYNYLPFTALPLYVALERIDRRVLEASQDLYANRRVGFTRVVLPLAIPGIFAAFLLTFVPAAGDYINAAILGGPNNTMIGNVIQTKFLVFLDYPSASALSVVLMVLMLIGIAIYAKVLGSRTIEEYV